MTDKFPPHPGLTNPPPVSNADSIADESGSDSKPRVRAAAIPGVIRRVPPTVSARTEQPERPAADDHTRPTLARSGSSADNTSASDDTASEIAAEGSDENVSKIRDILFGGQMKEYEVRFRNLEDHLQSENERSRLETERRFSRLESYIREEFGKLSSRIQHESSERTTAAAEIDKNIAAAESQMSALVQTLDSDLKRDYQDVRRNLYEQGLELEEKLRLARQELTNAMQTHSRQLQDDKLGRDMLAGLLDDLAVRLRGEHD